MKYVTILFMALAFSAGASAARPPGAAEPEEPKPPVMNLPEPDEPLPGGGAQMDDLLFKGPEGPPVPDPKDRDIFKLYEKEPDIPLFEPDIRFYDKGAKEPEPLLTAPGGELYFHCPKGMICR